VQKLPLSDSTGSSWSIAPPKVFKNTFSVRYNKLQPFFPLKISAGCTLVCGNGRIIERNIVANLRDARCLASSRWKDWSYQWFPVRLASSIDFICWLSWQGTHESLSIIRPICFIFLLAYTPLQPVSLQNWPITFQNMVWCGWNAKLCP